MSTAKTKVDKEIVEDFVKANFAKDAHSFESISDGEGSQGFFFSSKSGKWVIRVNKGIRGFEKDKYAFEQFHSNEIAIPETLSLGPLTDSLYFSITKRASGKLLSECSKEETNEAMPGVIKTLDAIHATDISNTSGFGWFDAKGKADLSSYRDYLEKLIIQMPKYLEENAGNKILEKDIIEGLLEKYKTLLDYCPDIRCLVHGDFGSNNATVENKKITGVFDWEHAMYGDFLYDVAWLDFWGNREGSDKSIDYKGILLKHYREKGVNIQNYEERILLYKLNFGIKSLSFFVYSNQEQKYLNTKTVLIKLAKGL